MTLSHKLTLVTVALLILGLGVSASAYTSYITGEDSVGSITCNATVSHGLDGIYTYSYELTYTTGTNDVHIFSVEDPSASEFFLAANVPADVPPVANHFLDPTYDVENPWVTWINGNLKAPVGGVVDTRTFSYQSYYAPAEIDVFTYVMNGGDFAFGTTLGMGALIPEPSSFAALLFGAVGLVPLVIRRRK